jgi:hypothetical protein
MDDATFPPDAASAISQAFALARLDDRLERGAAVTLEEVRAYLVDQITQLLDRNPALLMSILYRIDVAERDVKAVFSSCTPPEVPPRLADLIVARQLQKVQLRRRYRDEG